MNVWYVNIVNNKYVEFGFVKFFVIWYIESLVLWNDFIVVDVEKKF